MTDLSPAAQSILNVYYKSSYIKSGLVAVIRELADQAAPKKPHQRHQLHPSKLC